MKTRIKVETQADGTKLYFPEYQSELGSWWVNLLFGKEWRSSEYPSRGYCTTLENAQLEIDFHLDIERKKIEKENNEKVVKTEYIKYP